MQTIYEARVGVNLADGLSHDYPDAFSRSARDTVEIHDWSEALKLVGPVTVHDDEDGISLEVDGVHFPLTEA